MMGIFDRVRDDEGMREKKIIMIIGFIVVTKIMYKFIIFFK